MGVCVVVPPASTGNWDRTSRPEYLEGNRVRSITASPTEAQAPAPICRFLNTIVVYSSR